MKTKRDIIYNVLVLMLTVLISACSTSKLSESLISYNNGEYYKASNELKKIYRKTDSKKERHKKAELAWLIGNCYDKLMIWSQSSLYYQNAIRYGYNDSIVFLRLADSKLKEAKVKEATINYNLYLENHENDSFAINGLKSIELSNDKDLTFSRYQIKRFSLLNSRRAQFSPSIYGTNDEELYFTTSNDKNKSSINSLITGTKYFDIWLTKKDENGNWQKPEALGEEINTDNDEGATCFSADGNTMFYTVSYGSENEKSNPSIYYSKRDDGKWSKGTKLALSKDSIYLYAHPAISTDGTFLYFVSDMPGGYGGKDIWRAKLDGLNVSYIENLGEEINSAKDEMFPTISPDNRLFFSSNGKIGIGGLDIFAAREDEWGYWHVENLGEPINSSADDFGMTFKHVTKEEYEGWFSSNRNSPKGYDNIYSFTLPSIHIRITGSVYDTDGNPIPEAIVRVVGRNGMNYKSLTKPDGSYIVDIERSTEYVMMSGKNGFLNRKAQFMSDDEEDDADYEVDFFLPSVSNPIEVKNVFYDYNQATIRKESYDSLDDLYQLLLDNPYTAIELSAHTDRIGSDNFNDILSQKRAESVKEYLINKGIVEDRIVPVGYGKRNPVIVTDEISKRFDWNIGQILDEDFVNNLSENEKQYADQLNRRTEFKVITTTWGLK